MRTTCETRSAHIEETPMGNAKRGVTALGDSLDAEVTRGAWYTVLMQKYQPDGHFTAKIVNFNLYKNFLLGVNI